MPDQPQMQSVAQPVASDSPETQITPNLVSEQPPAASQPSAPQSGFQQVMQPTVQPNVQAPPQPPADPLASHPAVKQAGLLHRIATEIAGGPRIETKIDPATGETTRTRVPLTNSQLMTGILANVLGGLGNIAERQSDRMAGRPLQAIQPLPTQQAAAQRAQQSDSDFEREQQTKIQKSKILQANMEALRTGYSVGLEEDSAKDSYIKTHADELKQNQDSGNVKDSDVPSDQIPKNNYDLSDVVFIPDGRVPVYKDGQRVMKDGVPMSQLTYSVVTGNKQASLSQDDLNKFIKYGMMKPSGAPSDDGNYKLPPGSTLSQATINRMNHSVALVDQTVREFQRVNPDADIMAAIKKDPKGTLDAISKWHNDASSTEPDVQLDQVRQKHPDAASKIAALVGPENFQQYKEDRIAREATQKAQATKTGELAAETSTTGKAAAQQKADIAENARIDAEDRKQSAKDSSTMGYVEDQNGVLNYVSKAEATKAGSPYSAQTFQEVKPSDLSKDRAVIKPLGDVQMNISHYRGAANDYDTAVKQGRVTASQAANDKNNLTTIFSAPAVTDAASAHVGASGIGISVPTLSADLQAGLAKKVTNAYNALSPEGKLMADNYVRARAAIPAWVKALTNSGRGSKEQLDIELQNLLPPYYNIGDIHNRLDGFQDNLDNQKRTLPQNLLGRQIPDPVVRTDKSAQPQQNPPQTARPNSVQQKPAPAPEGTIVNTANGQMIKQGGQWVAYKGGQ